MADRDEVRHRRPLSHKSRAEAGIQDAERPMSQDFNRCRWCMSSSVLTMAVSVGTSVRRRVVSQIEFRPAIAPPHSFPYA
jgi:hypothetical protein